MTRILVMAHGRGTRMQPALGTLPKQLINLHPDVDDPAADASWSVLERTLWLLDGCNADVVTVGPKELRHVAIRNNSWLLDPGELGHCILDSLAATHEWWDSDRTVILLGDVVFSLRVLWAALSCTWPTTFVGTSTLTPTQGELFAMSFTGSVHDYLKRLLRDMPCRRAGHQNYQPGHLRNLAFEMMKHGAKHIGIDDYTDDLDEPKDLETLPELKHKAHVDLLSSFDKD